jgi:hypothetical protein
LAFASAQGFDFGAMENDARLEGFEDMIVSAGLGIGQNISHLLKNTRIEPDAAGARNRGLSQIRRPDKTL